MVRPRNNKSTNLKEKYSIGKGIAEINSQVDFYDIFWDVWHEKNRGFFSFFYHFDEKSRLKFIKKAIKKYLPNLKGKKAFDLGCGRGRIAFYLNKIGMQTTGIDLSEKTIKELQNKSKNINFYYGDIFSFDFTKLNHFDLVISSEVMEHIQIDKRNEYVRIIDKLLKKNGLLIITTPNMKEMMRLGWEAEQPLDFWMTSEELKVYFKEKFEIIEFQTCSFCFRNILINRIWKLIPFVNYFADKIIKYTQRGKYLAFIAKKK